MRFAIPSMIGNPVSEPGETPGTPKGGRSQASPSDEDDIYDLISKERGLRSAFRPNPAWMPDPDRVVAKMAAKKTGTTLAKR